MTARIYLTDQRSLTIDMPADDALTLRRELTAENPLRFLVLNLPSGGTTVVALDHIVRVDFETA